MVEICILENMLCLCGTIICTGASSHDPAICCPIHQLSWWSHWFVEWEIHLLNISGCCWRELPSLQYIKRDITRKPMVCYILVQVNICNILQVQLYVEEFLCIIYLNHRMNCGLLKAHGWGWYMYLINIHVIYTLHEIVSKPQEYKKNLFSQHPKPGEGLVG